MTADDLKVSARRGLDRGAAQIHDGPNSDADPAQLSAVTGRRPYRVSPAARRQRQTAALKHGAYAADYAVRLRQRRLRDRVRRLRADFPALAGKPRHLAVRYAEVDTIAAQVWNALRDTGIATDDGEPRRLLSEYRLLLGELRTLAAALGLLDVSDHPWPFGDSERGSR